MRSIIELLIPSPLITSNFVNEASFFSNLPMRTPISSYKFRPASVRIQPRNRRIYHPKHILHFYGSRSPLSRKMGPSPERRHFGTPRNTTLGTIPRAFKRKISASPWPTPFSALERFYATIQRKRYLLRTDMINSNDFHQSVGKRHSVGTDDLHLQMQIGQNGLKFAKISSREWAVPIIYRTHTWKSEKKKSWT